MSDETISLVNRGMPVFNPLAGLTDGIEEMVKTAIRDVVREEMTEQMAPVIELVTKINALLEVGKESKNLFVKALFKDMD